MNVGQTFQNNKTLPPKPHPQETDKYFPVLVLVFIILLLLVFQLLFVTNKNKNTAEWLCDMALSSNDKINDQSHQLSMHHVYVIVYAVFFSF